MKKCDSCFKYVLSIMTMTLFSICLVAQTPLYSVSKDDDSLRILDTTNYSIVSSIQMSSPTGAIIGCNGLAVHPCTGEIYIIMKIGTTRWLGKVDPATGIVIDIGDLFDSFAGIAFDSTEALYGVTGDGASVSSTLFLIDTTNAATFVILPLGNGDDGETIAYNPDDGLMYHFSGYSGGEIFESIDLNLLTTMPIPWTNPNVTTSETFSATYNGNGSFLLSGIDDSLFYLNTNGYAINPNIITPFSAERGLGYKLWHISVIGNTPICANDSAFLIASTGDGYQWYFNGSPLAGDTSQTMYTTIAGNYNCYIANGSCTDTTDVLVIVNPIPAVDLGTDTIICDTFTTNILLDAGAGNFSYLWQDSSTAQTFTVTDSGTYYVYVVDSIGCTNRDTVVILVDTCVGINETSLENIGMLCYPNPTNGSLTIELMLKGNKNAVLAISDVFGRLVYRKDIPWHIDPYTTRIDLSSHAKGVYVVELQTGTELIRQRVLVQ